MNRDKRSGFTLVEAVVATVLAAMGFAVVFQGLGGAARLTGASQESQKAVLVAQSVLAESLLDAQAVHDKGIIGDIAWTLDVSPLVQREDGVRLMRYTVLAGGARGRQVHLVAERTVSGNTGKTP